MSGIILGRTGRALKPLVLEEPGVQIYSLEELCYYIYNNIYILTNAFLDEKLIAFIRTEIKEPLLADKLEQLKCENAGLAEAVVTILKYVDYYDTAEIEQVKDLLAMLDTQNVYERMKMRADRFLEKGCYYSAISNYDKIVNGCFTQRSITIWELPMPECSSLKKRQSILKKRIKSVSMKSPGNVILRHAVWQRVRNRYRICRHRKKNRCCKENWNCLQTMHVTAMNTVRCRKWNT